MLSRIFRERARSRAISTLMSDGMPAGPGAQRFVDQAATAFAAPVALLTLLAGDQLLVGASKGLPIQCAPREQSFCTYAVDRSLDVFEVCDATADPNFRHLSAVAMEPHIRYYIGAPLKLIDGVGVGMLCVLDVRTRPPASSDQRAYLIGLARQATAALARNVRPTATAA